MEVIKLNLIPTGALPVVHASQYDDGRTFRADLYDGAEVYHLDGTETISCELKKPDGNIVTLAVTNTSESFIEIQTTEQACAVAGESLAEVKIEKGDDKIGSLNFILSVERSPIEGGIESESEINNLWTQVDGMVADILADSYDSANVVFDNEPTAGHGIPYTVTSEGIGIAIDDALEMTELASGAIATFESDYALPLRDLEIEINAVQEGGTPTPSSPKLISGFTGANITVAGSNLWDEEWESGSISSSTGQNTTGTGIRAKNYIPVKEDVIYYPRLNAELQTNATNIQVRFYDANKAFIGSDNYWGKTVLWNSDTTERTLRVPVGARFMRFALQPVYGSTYSNSNRISINYPATDTAYHAYNANSTTTAITWQSEAGTVYGGSLDVTSGVLTVTHESVDLGSLTWTNQGSGYFTSNDISSKNTSNTGLANAICSHYPVTTAQSLSSIYPAIAVGWNNRGVADIRDTDYTSYTAEQFATAMTGRFLVYELATPVTYQLTPQQITAIVGTNNIFTDTNGNTTLEYYTKRGEQTVHISEATAKEVINSATFGNLDTTDKTIVGAINEVNGMFEQGTSGKFTYRKWRNGVLEIWGSDHNNTWAPTWTAWGDGFFTTIASIGSYPIAFVDEPTVTVSLQPKGGQTFAGITDGNFANRYTQAPSVGAYRFTTDGGTLNEYVLSIYAIGKWKN